MTNELIGIIKNVAVTFGLSPGNVASFVEVETGGKGFSVDGKITIQFEPAWFKKQAPFAPSGLWSVNKVDVQVKEWTAFNDAFAKNPTAAMLSTSIGLGQIMGFHYKRLGYNTVGEMWDDAKKGLDRQIWQLCKCISTDIKLKSCLLAGDWDGVATLFNGAGYKALAAKYGREPYNISMAKAAKKYATL